LDPKTQDYPLRVDGQIVCETYCQNDKCRYPVDPITDEVCPRCKRGKPFLFAHEIDRATWEDFELKAKKTKRDVSVPNN